MNNLETAPQDTISAIEKQYSRSVCCGIYGLRNKHNNKWYVGQTVQPFNDRWLTYKRLECKQQPKLFAALIKYGYDSFEKIVLEMCPRDKQVLNQRETYWITEKDSVENGYNVLSIGGTSGMFGRSHSEESRRKISEKKKGKSFSDSHRKGISRGWITRKLRPDGGIPESAKIKLSIAHKGRALSEKHKQKLRVPKSPEHRQKIAEANRIRNAKLRGTLQTPELVARRVAAWKASRIAKQLLQQ